MEIGDIVRHKLTGGKILNSHGGARKGSGRKKKEPVKYVRVPLSKLAEVKKIIGKV